MGLSLIYIGLFIIISENIKESIKEMIINQTLKLIYYYEQLIYLKIKIIIKSLNILKNIKQKKVYKNLNNIINYKLKNIKQNGANNRKKISNMRKLNNILFFLIFKTYK